MRAMCFLLSFMVSASAQSATFCPQGFVRVRGLPASNNPKLPKFSDFCVMKYEAKKISLNGKDYAVSRPQGEPWVQVNRQQALKACEAIDPFSYYTLMGLLEWQVIARNIETHPVNWSGGVVGKGQINQGHVSPTPSHGLSAPIEYKPDSSCFPDQTSCSPVPWSRYDRQHYLRSGEPIWDFSGNVWEWSRDTLHDIVSLYYGPNKLKTQHDPLTYRVTIDANIENTPASHIRDPLIRNLLGSAHNYSQSSVRTLGYLWVAKNMGYDYTLDEEGIKLTSYRGGLIRGGSFGSTLDAGIYAASTYIHRDEKRDDLGFRCVYYPNPVGRR